VGGYGGAKPSRSRGVQGVVPHEGGSVGKLERPLRARAGVSEAQQVGRQRGFQVGPNGGGGERHAHESRGEQADREGR
jgi:hypothetical protein